MQISTKDWKNYISRLSALNNKASSLMSEWVAKNGFSDTEALIDFAYAIVTKYGEGSAELTCQMYDAIAEMEGKILPAAVPAQTATYDETAKAVKGCLKRSPSGALVASTSARLVKQVGADTMIHNALRDGAEFAWIPSGDTCPFCLMLASNGWRRASKKAIKKGHAEHIHSNCDCQYCVRFSSDTTVAGYDPDKYLSMYDSYEGSWNDKVNAMRRAHYAENKDKINAQKRAAYIKRKDNGIVDDNLLRIPQISASTITQKVRDGEYSLKLSVQQFDKHVEGTREYQQYMESRINKGLNAQSKLNISRDEASKIIEKYSGTGIIKVRRDGTPLNIEQITVDRVIGSYMQHGEWVETKKAAIHYSRKGAHIVPIKGNNYD